MNVGPGRLSVMVKYWKEAWRWCWLRVRCWWLGLHVDYLAWRMVRERAVPVAHLARHQEVGYVLHAVSRIAGAGA